MRWVIGMAALMAVASCVAAEPEVRLPGRVVVFSMPKGMELLLSTDVGVTLGNFPRKDYQKAVIAPPGRFALMVRSVKASPGFVAKTFAEEAKVGVNCTTESWNARTRAGGARLVNVSRCLNPGLQQREDVYVFACSDQTLVEIGVVPGIGLEEAGFAAARMAVKKIAETAEEKR